MLLKFLVFVLIPVTLILLAIYVEALFELYKEEKEAEKDMIRGGMEGYLDQTFGFKKVKIFKSVLDADGNVCYLVYLPHNDWFKGPKYQWYEVYKTSNGFAHSEIEGR